METNPCKLVKKLRAPKIVMQYYTASEFKIFLGLFTQEEYSFLINNGIDSTKISKRLSHASITITLDMYSHYITRYSKVRGFNF